MMRHRCPCENASCFQWVYRGVQHTGRLSALCCAMALGKPAGTSRSQHLCGGIDMTLSMARQIVLAARPQGTPQLTDFRLEDTALPTPAAGGTIHISGQHGKREESRM